jgi:hypothetical protein
MIGMRPGCVPCRSRQQQQLARKRREFLDMVPEFYDIENSQRTEDEIGALRQVRSQGCGSFQVIACHAGARAKQQVGCTKQLILNFAVDTGRDGLMKCLVGALWCATLGSEPRNAPMHL